MTLCRADLDVAHASVSFAKGAAVKTFRAINAVLLVVVAACAPPTVYRSSGPEVRGEVSITSDVELVSELDMRTWSLGVLYAKERSHTGVLQNVLFAARSGGPASAARVTAYSLRRTASISLEQARRLLVAVDTFLGMDAASLGPMKLFNFELSAGPLDVAVGPPDHHPFTQITFSVICSVTTAGKYFALMVPRPDDERMFWTIELSQEGVQALRQAIDSAVKKGD
jgi:hypothetical protein